MITGDHPGTASAIAVACGLARADDPVLTGMDVAHLSDDALTRAVGSTAVYARVDPAQKLRIVQALRRRGEVVAMTGDGVNDAPALKAADTGVAMGRSGTDVAREAADLIVTDDRYTSILAAVEEGRHLYADIQTFLRYLMFSNAGEVLSMFIGVLAAVPLGLSSSSGAVILPLLPAQLLWINLISDGAPALALGFDRPTADVMTVPPRPAGRSIVTPSMWQGAATVSVLTALTVLGTLDAALPGGVLTGTGDLRHARTLAFTTLMFASLYNALNARSDTQSALPSFFKGRWLWSALILSLGLHVLVVTVPALQVAFQTTALSWLEWLSCLGAASTVLWGQELLKAARRWRQRRRTGPRQQVAPDTPTPVGPEVPVRRP